MSSAVDGPAGDAFVSTGELPERMGTFAPPLDREGNSVKGRLVAKFLSARLGLDLLISRPARPINMNLMGRPDH